MTIDELLADRRICVCLGAGGVGKTTTSAAIAAGIAAQGYKVAVVTIDPAKRLADSLGLDKLDNEPRRVDPKRFRKASGSDEGELWAMMLDVKRTFDEVISRLASDDEARDRVLNNRIYKRISSSIAGSQEFTAIAKLHELDDDDDFDLIVLDTPPSRNALDFLDAPDRLTNFLEGRALRIFLKPAGFGLRIAGRGGNMLFGVLKRVTGVDLLRDMSEFFQAVGGMLDGFRERALKVDELLSSPGTAFLVVTAPGPESIDEALFLKQKLVELSMPFAGVVVNRVHRTGPVSVALTKVADELDQDLDAELTGRVVDNLREWRTLTKRDLAAVKRLEQSVDKDRVVQVPQLASDVHEIEDLVEISHYLFAGPIERDRLLDVAAI